MAIAATSTPTLVSSVELRVGSSQRLRTVKLSKGTILFRAIYLRNPTDDPYGIDLFQDFLGFPVGAAYCLSPIQNVYTFPIPYVGFGLYDWTTAKEAWRKYNSIMVYALTEDISFITLIAPAAEVRGSPKGWKYGDIMSRCDVFSPTVCYRGRVNEIEKTAAFQRAQSWDNCLHPEKRIIENIGGWIAVAEADSIDIRKKNGRIQRPKTTPMGSYLTSLSPRDFSESIPHLVVDSRNTRGFPEIVVNPRLPSKSLSETRFLRVNSFEESLELVSNELRNKNISIAPIATITEYGFYFYGNRDNTEDRLPQFYQENIFARTGNSFPEERRRRIEYNSFLFLEKLGKGEIGRLPAATFDRRTGYFVLGGAGQDGRMSLREPRDWLEVSSYCIRVKGGIPGSEYIFKRPPSIQNVLRDLEIPAHGNTELARTARNLIEMEQDMGTVHMRTSRNNTRHNRHKGGGNEKKSMVSVSSSPLLSSVFNKRNKTKKGNTSTKILQVPEAQPISPKILENIDTMYTLLGSQILEIFK